MTIYAAVWPVHPTPRRTLFHAGSHRVRAARGVLRGLRGGRAVRRHRGADARHGGAGRGRLAALAAHPAAALAVGGAGADLRWRDARAAQPALHPVEADGVLLAGEPRVPRQRLDWPAHALRAAARTDPRRGLRYAP